MFAFQSYLDYTDLHCFPTRRSSDLLESQMHEKQELLKSRSTELEALTSEVASLSGRLTDLASTKERAENLLDRKSTRLNYSHQINSYAVFCLKKKRRTVNALSGRFV